MLVWKRCYKHSEEIPKQINLTELKSGFGHARFVAKFQFGWETEPTGLGETEAVIF